MLNQLLTVALICSMTLRADCPLSIPFLPAVTSQSFNSQDNDDSINEEALGESDEEDFPFDEQPLECPDPDDRDAEEIESNHVHLSFFHAPLNIDATVGRPTHHRDMDSYRHFSLGSFDLLYRLRI